MTQVRDQLSLLESEDIFRYVLSEWLTLKDQVNLDQALPNSKRAVLHATMKKIPLSQPFANNQEKWWTHHKNIFTWMSARGLYRTKGWWSLHDKIWNTLISSNEYNTILESIECIRFENFNKSFDMNQFAVCTHLKHLKLYNLDGKSVTASTRPVFPALETLLLQNCNLTPSILKTFAGCTNLTDVTYTHNDYSGLNNISAAEKDEIAPFFQRMTSFSLSAHMGAVLNSHFPPGPLPQLRTVVLDNIHRNETSTEVLTNFVERLEQVTDLTITRSRFNFAIVVNKIRESCHQLTTLHLNHCRWQRAEGEAEPDTPVVGASDKLTTLKLTTPLPMFDADLGKLLGLCGQTVLHLQLTFCARLTTSAYTLIEHHVPRLQSLLVEYSKEDGYFNADHFAALESRFSRLQKLKIVEWETWLSDSLKAANAAKSTVILEKGNA